MSKKLSASTGQSPVHKKIKDLLIFTMQQILCQKLFVKLGKARCKRGIVTGAATFCDIKKHNLTEMTICVHTQFVFIQLMYQSIPSTNIPLPGDPGVLHLLSAQVPGFLPSELSRVSPGVRPII